MRLLHIDQAGGRLVLTDFSGKTIPPYAILSHRWGESEVLFADIANGVYERKEGYQKIQFCAEQAAKDQLQYFWIDTCCIDKWNLSELSRSINSMFRWYQEATKCYVFLADVSLRTAEAIIQEDWKSSFRKSAWFTRGWTLQELIAPTFVEFFSSEKVQIGDKQSLSQLLHEITNIPVKAFSNPLEEFTIPDRMRWAENRKTTEPEDKVYCLLGLLDIFMPTSYGEGEEKAKRRLEIEIDAATSAPSVIPFPQNHRYIGWETHLVELKARLFKEDQSTTIVLLGPRGIGKSQFALEFAYRIRQKEGYSVFWVDASSMGSFYRSYANIARKLRISKWGDNDTHVVELVNGHLTRENVSRFLLILDNADNIHLGSGADRLDKYIPMSKQCSILLTTIDNNAAKILAPEKVMELGEITSETAQKMFENYLHSSVSAMEQLDIMHLIQELAYLPLALVQAAAYINMNNITVQEYRIRLAGLQKPSLGHKSQLIEGKNHERGAKDPVSRTLLLSMDQISHVNWLASNYLSLVACLDQRDIPLELLEASSTYRNAEEAIKLLDNYALIRRRQADSSIDIHQLVHSALRKQLQSQNILIQWRQKAIWQLLSIFPDPDHSDRHKWRRLLPHAKYILSQSTSDLEDGPNTIVLRRKYGIALLTDEMYNEAAAELSQATETYKTIFGNEHPTTLVGMGNLASAFSGQGRWEEAEKLDVQVVETFRKTLGNDDEFTVRSMGNLAATYRLQGQWKKAEEIELQVMESRRRVFKDDHPDTLASLANLAATYKEQGRWKEAEKILVKVMETSKRVLSDDDPNMLRGMSNVAGIYMMQGKWNEAEELETEVLKKSRRMLGEKHPNTLACMANLADTYRIKGYWKKAQRLGEQVVQARTEVLGSESLHTLTSVGNLALTYKGLNQFNKAEELEVRVMTTFKEVLGEGHPDTLTSIARLATTYGCQGQWKKAEELEVQVMDTSRRVLGEEHPDTLSSMGNLACTLKAQGCTVKAYSLMETCFKLRAFALGHRHPDTLTSLKTLMIWKIEGMRITK